MSDQHKSIVMLHDDGSLCDHSFAAIAAEPPLPPVEAGDQPWVYEALYVSGQLVRKSFVIQRQNPAHVVRLLEKAQVLEPQLPWDRAELIGENAWPYPAGLSVYFHCPLPASLLSRFRAGEAPAPPAPRGSGAEPQAEPQWWDYWSIKLPAGKPAQLKVYDLSARAAKCWPELPPSAGIIFGISKVYPEKSEWGVYFETSSLSDVIVWAAKCELQWPCTNLPKEGPWNFAVEYNPSTLEIVRFKHFHLVSEAQNT